MEENALVGSRMPHVTLTTTGGGSFVYTGIWQRRQLLLVLLPRRVDTRHPEPGEEAAWAALETSLEDARQTLSDMDTVLVISSDPVPGIGAPRALVADRWGEVTHAAGLRIEDGRATPGRDTLLTWAEATLHRCPECEGEAK